MKIWRKISVDAIASTQTVTGLTQDVTENLILVGKVTNLQSSSERMISYRHQERMWLTEDGGMHLIINEGNNSTNRSVVPN
ncbi:MAG: hypothetical protein C6Y22_04835 [Hapalosiphonaceae cyanobacterium JJU2]|nr:MAG: hypothetical protein C6Y22_04835 [Hapalosiphonaceae cyanobacterium JJU2]